MSGCDALDRDFLNPSSVFSLMPMNKDCSAADYCAWSAHSIADSTFFWRDCFGRILEQVSVLLQSTRPCNSIGPIYTHCISSLRKKQTVLYKKIYLCSCFQEQHSKGKE